MRAEVTQNDMNDIMKWFAFVLTSRILHLMLVEGLAACRQDVCLVSARIYLRTALLWMNYLILVSVALCDECWPVTGG